jgi:APA family basic amino acid/polyamine antiporter
MSLKSIFAKKPVSQILSECENSGLKRTLNSWNLVLLGIGCVIGTGIFVLTGQQAALNAGPAIAISFVLAGLAAAFAALCYAELSSMLPVSGSAYTYAYASLGEFFAWVMGWLLILEYGTAAATVAVGWSGYVTSLLTHNLGLDLPLEYTKAAGVEIKNQAGEIVAHGIFNVPAFVAALLVTILLVVGVKESAKVNNVIVAVKLSVLVAFIGIGIFHIDTSLWHPFIPDVSLNPKGEEGYGFAGVAKAASVIFFAYIGFEAVSTAAQESTNPKRDIPIGILGSLAVCTVLYILVSLVLTGIVPYKELNVDEPIAKAVDYIGLGNFAILIKIGAIMGLSSVMLVLVYGQTRIFFAMSRDGLLPSVFSKLHSKFHTPYVNTILVGSLVALGAGTTPLSKLGDLVSVGTLLAFSIICGTVMYLRVKSPETERRFRVPLYPFVPLFGIGMCLYLVAQLGHTFYTLKYYLLAGLAIYFVYSRFHSKLNNNK